MLDALEIAINVVTDAKEKLGEVGRSFDDLGESGARAADRLEDMRAVMARLIEQERLEANMKAAAEAVELLTEEEKDAVVQAQRLVDAEREAAQATGDFEEEVASFSFTEFNQAVELAGKALEALKKVWDFSKEGAGNIRIANQFRDAMQEIGVNADVLIAKLMEVADHTVDDEALMQTATRAFTNELVGSQDELVSLFEVARAASVRFGGDTAEAFERIAEATEVGTARSLKQVGIVVDFDKAHKELAKSLGKTVDQLTVQEMKQARLNVVLEAGAALVAKVGDSADDQLTKIQQLENGVGELLDGFKELAATVVVDVIAAGDEFINREQHIIEGLEKQEDQTWDTAESYQEYVARMKDAARAVNLQIDAEGNLVKTTIGLAGQTKAITQANFLFSESVFKAAQESKRWVDVEQLRIGRFIESARAAEEAAVAEERAAARRERIGEAMATAQERAIAYTEAAEQLGELEAELAIVDEEIAERGERRNVVRQASVETVAAHGEAVLRLTIAEQNLTEVTRREGETDAEFSLRQLESTQRVMELGAAVGELGGKLGGHVVSVGGATKAQQENRDAILAQIEAFKEQQESLKAVEAFKALAQAYKDKKINLDEYRTATEKLNEITGLYTDSALKAAVKQEELLAIIGDADSTLDDITTALDKNKEAIDGVAESTDKEKEATEKAGTAAQLAVPKMTRLATKFGEVDEAAYLATDRVVTFRGALDELEDTTVTLTFRIDTVGSIPEVAGVGFPGGIIPVQHGFNYTVPAGYPNDSMLLPLAVSTGEEVTVRPAGQPASAQTIIGGDNIYINDRLALAMYYEEKRARLLVDAQGRMGG
jgi:hypothetical protein